MTILTQFNLLFGYVLCALTMLIIGKLASSLTPEKIFSIFLVCLINVAAVFYTSNNNMPLPLIYISIMLIMVLESMLVFRSQFLVILWSVLALILTMVCLRGIVTSIYAFASFSSVYEVMCSEHMRTACQLITNFLMSALLIILFCLPIKQYFDSVLRSSSQFYLVTAVESIILLYSLMLSFAYYIDISIYWFTSFILISMLALQFAHILVLRHAILVSRWLDEDIKQSILSSQLERQLTHYRAYQRHIEAFEDFRQKYYTVTGELRHKLQLSDKDGALQLLESTDTQIDKLSRAHTEYSNSMLVDAILEDYHGQCAEHNITFSAKVFIPDTLALSDLQLCRLFGNIFSNALDSCLKLPKTQQAYIHFETVRRDGWLTIEETNAMCGNLNYKNGKLITDKQNKEYHGMGLGIIRDISESVGGFVELGSAGKSEFYLRIHLPLI